ncbi:MAG: hypothetical protein MK008_11640 [Bdellovibrionales bacterium]|nr:hypothetical protein [Bdellovibrionales bacterium]
MTQEQTKQAKPVLLWWFNKENKKNIPAGVAFYDEKFGEYRLKIDIHPDTQYYLKPTGSQNEEIHFRAEVVIKKNGKFHQRKVVGEGIASRQTNGDVFIDFGPYSKLLVMGLSNND